MLSLFFSSSSSSSFSSAPLPALLARPGNSSRARGEEAPRPSLLGPMASTEATGAGDGAEANATTTRRSDDEAFDAFDADDSETAFLSTAGALSPRSVPPPDEIRGPPRRPFRRRGAHASPSSRLRDPSESGGFGGRRRDGNGNGTFSSSNSTSSLSLGTKLLKLFLANWDRALVLAALIAATVLVSMRGVQFLKDALAWLQRHSGWAGWGIFTASYAAAISFLLPGVAAVLGAGFVFGFWRGLLAVWVGGAAGQVGAFLLSRYLLGRSVSGLLKGSRLWASVDAAIESGEGWKLLLLLRLSPVIPYNLLNLAAAATSVGLVPFALASAVGIVPECTLLVYAGSLAESITAVVSGTATKKHRKVTWILGGLTIAAGVAAGVAATLLVRRAVKRAAARADALADEQEEEEDGGFLLSLDHETFDRNSFGGDGVGGGGAGGISSSWLSPPSPPLPPLSGENGNGGSATRPPPPKATNGASSSLIDV